MNDPCASSCVASYHAADCPSARCCRAVSISGAGPVVPAELIAKKKWACCHPLSASHPSRERCPSQAVHYRLYPLVQLLQTDPLPLAFLVQLLQMVPLPLAFLTQLLQMVPLPPTSLIQPVDLDVAVQPAQGRLEAEAQTGAAVNAAHVLLQAQLGHLAAGFLPQDPAQGPTPCPTPKSGPLPTSP